MSCNDINSNLKYQLETETGEFRNVNNMLPLPVKLSKQIRQTVNNATIIKFNLTLSWTTTIQECASTTADDQLNLFSIVGGGGPQKEQPQNSTGEQRCRRMQ